MSISLHKKLSLLVEEPKILIGKVIGLKPMYLHHCLTVKRLFREEIKTIIDVGANRGEFAKSCRYVFPQAKIFAFEPLPKYKQKLDSIKNLKLFGYGLWNKNGIGIFNYNKKADRRSTFLSYGRCNSFDDSNIEKMKIKQRRFDSFSLSIERPCYCKVDVEGGELNVLLGFGNKLKEIDVLQVEVNFIDNYHNQANYVNIFEILQKEGFKRFFQSNVAFYDDNISRCDLFFLR